MSVYSPRKADVIYSSNWFVVYAAQFKKRFGFNPSELGIIYKGYVRPLLEYGDVVWGSSLTCDRGTTLEKVQKRACKIILGKNFNSYTDAMETCDLDTLSDCRKIHSRNLRNLCQIVNAQAPSFHLQGDLCMAEICAIPTPFPFCPVGLSGSERVRFPILLTC